jgi:endonuclease/exonuclease/phosphatase family metal-dependent hydrolase
MLRILLVLTLAAAQEPGVHASEMELKAMSFNVRWDGLDKGTYAWENRKSVVLKVILAHSPDIIGLQEPSTIQTQDLNKALIQYESFQAAHERDQHIPFLFRSDRFTLTDGGSFWLVEHSDLSGGTRRCTWIQLTEIESSHTFYVFNSHFDHRSALSRVQSAQRLIEGIQRVARDTPYIVMGDFNETKNGNAISLLKGNTIRLKDSYENRNPRAVAEGTGHGFTGKTDGKRIDYIFVRPQDDVLKATIIHDNSDGLYPSDHFPVTATVGISL